MERKYGQTREELDKKSGLQKDVGHRQRGIQENSEYKGQRQARGQETEGETSTIGSTGPDVE